MPGPKLAAIQEGRSGVGLRGMKDRVRHFNGEMTLNSNPTGTIVSITLPTQNTALPVAV
jgi:signal transduction histidine kinase